MIFFQEQAKIQCFIQAQKIDYKYCLLDKDDRNNPNKYVSEKDYKFFHTDRRILFEPYHKKITLSFNDFGVNDLKSFLKYLLSLLGVKRFREYFKNLTPDSYLEKICQHIAGESTPLLFPSHVAVSTQFDLPTQVSTMSNQIGKALISNVSRNGKIITVQSTLNPNIGTTITTTISSVVDQSTFYVVSGSFQNGDRIRILGQERKTVGVLGSLVKVTQPFTVTLAPSQTLEQMISQLHLVNDNQLNYNSGQLISIASYPDTKTATQAIEFIHTIKVF